MENGSDNDSDNDSDNENRNDIAIGNTTGGGNRGNRGEKRANPQHKTTAKRARSGRGSIGAPDNGSNDNGSNDNGQVPSIINDQPVGVPDASPVGDMLGAGIGSNLSGTPATPQTGVSGSASASGRGGPGRGSRGPVGGGTFGLTRAGDATVEEGDATAVSKQSGRGQGGRSSRGGRSGPSRARASAVPATPAAPLTVLATPAAVVADAAQPPIVAPVELFIDAPGRTTRNTKRNSLIGDVVPTPYVVRNSV